MYHSMTAHNHLPRGVEKNSLLETSAKRRPLDQLFVGLKFKSSKYL